MESKITGNVGVISEDKKEFDRHNTHFLLKFDVIIYKYFMQHMDFGEHEIHKDMITKIFQNIDYKIMHKILGLIVDFQGVVPSGKSNTTEGNTFRNILHTSFIMHKAGLCYRISKFDNILIGGIKQNASKRAAGDDSVVFVQSDKILDYCKAMDSVYTTTPGTGLGHELKTCVVGSTADIEFLSLRFLRRDDGTYRAIRKNDRLVMQFGWSLKLKAHEFDKAAMMRYCDGHCMDACYGDLPIYRAICHNLIQSGMLPTQQFLDSRSSYQNYDHTAHIRKPEDIQLFYEYLEDQHSISKQEVDILEMQILQASVDTVIISDTVDKLLSFNNVGIYEYKDGKLLPTPPFYPPSGTVIFEKNATMKYCYNPELYDIKHAIESAYEESFKQWASKHEYDSWIEPQSQGLVHQPYIREQTDKKAEDAVQMYIS
jgi:hypothetical protein